MTSTTLPTQLACAIGLILASHALAAKESPAVQRGGYLVHAMGCADCHTPLKMGPQGPEPDTARGLSGHPQSVALPPAPAGQGPWIWGGAATNTAFYGPWGTSFAANLTPDVQTGLGGWTQQQFIATLRKGQHAGGGRPIAPPMPWAAVGQLTTDDLRAVWAYLRAQPAVSNAVPALLPPPARP